MLKIVFGNAFKRDYKRLAKRGYDIQLLDSVMGLLASGVQLDEKFSDHLLKGDWKGYRECHIEPDWIFIYARDEASLYCARTGTHSDILKL